MENDPEVTSTCSRGLSGCLCTKQNGWSSVVCSVRGGLEGMTRDSGLVITYASKEFSRAPGFSWVTRFHTFI